MIIKIILTSLLVLIVLICVYFYTLSFKATAPQPQLINGSLRPCPNKPNCVSSESSLPYAVIKPIAYSSSSAQAWNDIRTAIQAAGGTIKQDDNKLIWASFTSLIFRFVDDVEIRLDASSQTIHIRSASRVGHSDFGANRKRLEKIRSLFKLRQNQ